MIKDAIGKLKTKTDLTQKEMTTIFNEIMDGAVEENDVKEFLLSLKNKGESLNEIVAAARVMRERALKVNIPTEELIDTCGTGGAKIRDINVSTIVAIVLAACGAKVAKHGNRSFTGKCGSADLLEELGVNIHMNPKKVSELIDEIGFGFMFAPDYHPAMKNVLEARKELGTKTIFNILGPLSNPAGVTIHLLGVYDANLTELMAEILNKMAVKKAIVVHGLEGLDEISIKGRTKVTELRDGKIKTYFVTPSDFGLKEGHLSEVEGGDRKHNASVALDILTGKKGMPRDIVLINASAALRTIGRARDFKDGVELISDCIDSGKALETLERLKQLSNQ